jgi:hypothetical protein
MSNSTPPAATAATAALSTQSLWVDGNGDVIQEHCKAVFIGQWESVHIARAINTSLKVGDPIPRGDVSKTLLFLCLVGIFKGC